MKAALRMSAGRRFFFGYRSIMSCLCKRPIFGAVMLHRQDLAAARYVARPDSRARSHLAARFA